MSLTANRVQKKKKRSDQQRSVQEMKLSSHQNSCDTEQDWELKHHLDDETVDFLPMTKPVPLCNSNNLKAAQGNKWA